MLERDKREASDYRRGDRDSYKANLSVNKFLIFLFVKYYNWFEYRLNFCSLRLLS